MEYAVFEDQRKENLRIIRDICDAVERGKSYRDFAVLFRTNTQPRLLMEQMMEYNIPFRTRDRIPNLYEHWIAKDIFAYIRIAQGSRERRDFLQIMNRSAISAEIHWTRTRWHSMCGNGISERRNSRGWRSGSSRWSMM